MSGRNSGRRSRRSRGTAAGVAAALLPLLIVVLLSGVWPSPVTVELSLAFPPPRELWIVLVLVLLAAQTIVTYLYFLERSRGRALAGDRADIEEPEPELRPP